MTMMVQTESSFDAIVSMGRRLELKLSIHQGMRNGAVSHAEARDLLSSSKGLLLDWDGCVAFGNRPDRNALNFIREHRQKIAIISNNSTHLPKDFAQILTTAGAPISPDRILLAGTEALKRAKEREPRGVLILGDTRMKAHARNLGVPVLRDKADLVVLLRDTRFSYSKLERAANCLKEGAGLIIANPDLTHPGRNGRVVPETGALHAALMACTGDHRIEIEVIGKPEPGLFKSGCQALQIAPEEAVMIGDNPATDMAGADAFGMHGLLIGPRSGLHFGDLL